jgi:hypothetical protein
MTNVKTSGPQVRQIVFYNDAVFGPIAALITAVSLVDGTISLTTFPPGVASQNQTGSPYDYTGSIVGSWNYGATDFE